MGGNMYLNGGEMCILQVFCMYVLYARDKDCKKGHCRPKGPEKGVTRA
jgi:hypothetical protein